MNDPGPGHPGTRTRRPAPGWGAASTPSGPGRNAYLPPPTHNPHLPPLDEQDTTPHPNDRPRTRPMGAADPQMPRKLTVARVAAMRSRELTGKGINKIAAAATADGADQSGLTALTLPVVANFAVDAAMAVALANTLFFASASGDKGGVALYLLLTIAPFALIAPLIGPMLDRLQKGRRIAMATTFALRVVLALLIMANVTWDDAADQLSYDPYVLYPCALGLLVLSKSFGVLKSAVTPRVVPPTIDLPRTNSRLTTFGLLGGTIVGGAIAGIVEVLLSKLLPFHLPGALLWLAVVAAAGAYFCMRIPSWVESTEGEIPTTITYHGEPARSSVPEQEPSARGAAKGIAAKMRQPLGRKVVAGLWGNGTIRILTGFLTMFIAFYAKDQQTHHGASGAEQLMLLGVLGAAAGIGNAIGNGAGTRLELKNPPSIIVWATTACFVVAVGAAVFGNVLAAAIAAFVASGGSAIGKVCLDSSIQDDLPDESRASAFGLSETVLQLSWVVGAALGVLLPPKIWLGFTVVAVLLGIGLVQTVLTTRGSTLIPGFGGRRPDHAAPTMAFAAPETTTHARRGPDDRPAGPGAATTRAHQQRPRGSAPGDPTQSRRR